MEARGWKFLVSKKELMFIFLIAKIGAMKLKKLKAKENPDHINQDYNVFKKTLINQIGCKVLPASNLHLPTFFTYSPAR
jgi:hypothetical protein